MANKGTVYIRRVIIENKDGVSMDDMDFSLDFFIHTSRKIRFKKDDLIHIVHGGESMYFAPLDSSLLGTGVVNCKLTVYSPERMFLSGKRTISITRVVGLVIGVNCSDNDAEFGCFEEGYRMRFEPYIEIPEQDGADIMYGVLTIPIASYDTITSDMVQGFETSSNLSHHPISFNMGDKVVILVKDGVGQRARKDSGFGDLVDFSTTLCGSTGDVKLLVNGTTYRVYGEMMLISGEIFITVN